MSSEHEYEIENRAANIIRVPDVSEHELVALAKLRGDLTFINSTYDAWQFHRGYDGEVICGRGEPFTFLTWKPGRRATSNEVRAYFKTRGFHGNVAAFIAWVMEFKPAGEQASIPDDNACWRHPDRRLCAPHSCFGGGLRELSHRGVSAGWPDTVCFVGFRKL